jgi:hypothetical protein
MKWMKERDLLIAQTLAFVQSVTGKKPDAGMFAGALEPETATTTTTVIDIDALLAESTVISRPAVPAPSESGPSKSELAESEPVAPVLPKSEPPKPIQVSRAEAAGDFQSEINARIANFRAHQERFLRERDEYCTATMAKVRASLRENTEPSRSVE